MGDALTHHGKGCTRRWVCVQWSSLLTANVDIRSYLARQFHIAKYIFIIHFVHWFDGISSPFVASKMLRRQRHCDNSVLHMILLIGRSFLNVYRRWRTRWVSGKALWSQKLVFHHSHWLCNVNLIMLFHCAINCSLHQLRLSLFEGNKMPLPGVALACSAEEKKPR